MIRALALIALFFVGCAGSPRIDAIAARARLVAFPHIIESNDGMWLVGIDLSGDGDAHTPPFDTPYALSFAIEPADGDRSNLADVTIVVDCTMPQHGHGMNVVPSVRRSGPGRFTARGFELFMEGEWLLTIDITKGIYTERAQWWIEPQ